MALLTKALTSLLLAGVFWTSMDAKLLSELSSKNLTSQEAINLPFSRSSR